MQSDLMISKVNAAMEEGEKKKEKPSNNNNKKQHYKTLEEKQMKCHL